MLWYKLIHSRMLGFGQILSFLLQSAMKNHWTHFLTCITNHFSFQRELTNNEPVASSKCHVAIAPQCIWTTVLCFSQCNKLMISNKIKIMKLFFFCRFTRKLPIVFIYSKFSVAFYTIILLYLHSLAASLSLFVSLLPHPFFSPVHTVCSLQRGTDTKD